MKVFITGATGFLGQHITKACLEKGHEVTCLRRPTSTYPFDENTGTAIRWITLSEGWQQELRDWKPDVLVHAAWGGVSAEGRNNPEIQQANVRQTAEIMTAAPYRQIVMLGSQDEYGQIDNAVNENHPLHPHSEYAKAKIACQQALQEHAEANGMEWQWIRIFSIYGEGQRKEWLIPSLITKCLSGTPTMQTTPGEQVYSYLHCSDFAQAIASIIGTKGKSGIYNLSSTHPIALKDLFQLIKTLTHSCIVFQPSLPYRENQSMMILGDSTRFIQAFGPYEKTTLEEGLNHTIQHIPNIHEQH